jgi:hypothetical protein
MIKFQPYKNYDECDKFLSICVLNQEFYKEIKKVLEKLNIEKKRQIDFLSIKKVGYIPLDQSYSYYFKPIKFISPTINYMNYQSPREGKFYNLDKIDNLVKISQNILSIYKLPEYLEKILDEHDLHFLEMILLMPIIEKVIEGCDKAKDYRGKGKSMYFTLNIPNLFRSDSKYLIASKQYDENELLHIEYNARTILSKLSC